MLALSIIWVAIPFTLFPLAEQHINSAVTGLLNGAVPMFTALFGLLFFGRRTNGPQLVGLGVGLVGVVLISLPSLSEGSSQALGVGLVLVATLCYGLATNLSAPLQARYGSRAVMARMLALATLWTLPFGLVSVPDSHVEAAPLLAVIVLGIVGTGVAYLLMGSLDRARRPHPRLVHHLPDPGGVARARRRLPRRPRRRPRDRRRRPRHHRRRPRQQARTRLTRRWRGAWGAEALPEPPTSDGAAPPTPEPKVSPPKADRTAPRSSPQASDEEGSVGAAGEREGAQAPVGEEERDDGEDARRMSARCRGGCPTRSRSVRTSAEADEGGASLPRRADLRDAASAAPISRSKMITKASDHTAARLVMQPIAMNTAT